MGLAYMESTFMAFRDLYKVGFCGIWRPLWDWPLWHLMLVIVASEIQLGLFTYDVFCWRPYIGYAFCFVGDPIWVTCLGFIEDPSWLTHFHIWFSQRLNVGSFTCGFSIFSEIQYGLYGFGFGFRLGNPSWVHDICYRYRLEMDLEHGM